MGNNRTKIGMRAVEGMEPHSILWDAEIRGFNARRQFSDAVTYSVFYRTADGTQRFHKIGRHGVFRPEQARSEARRVLMAAALGQDPSGDRTTLRQSLTVAQLCDEYSAKVNGKKATTIKSDNSRIKAHIKPKIGRLKVTSITRDQIEEFMHSMSPASGKRTVALLGAILTYAVKRKLRPDNPVHGIEKPKDNKRVRRLSVAEYAQLGSALNGNNIAKDIFMFLAVSGWRSGEAKNLKYSELDLDRRVANTCRYQIWPERAAFRVVQFSGL